MLHKIWLQVLFARLDPGLPQTLLLLITKVLDGIPTHVRPINDGQAYIGEYHEQETFFKMGHPRPLYRFFVLFKHALQLLQQLNVKQCPSS